MLDSLLVNRSLRRDEAEPGYKPELAIESIETVNETGSTLNVLFPPWHGGGILYQRLVRRVARDGGAVRAYNFHNGILGPDVDAVAKSFNQIRDEASDQLAEIEASGDYDSIRLIAMSLGNPAMAMVASSFRNFDSAVLVTPPSIFADGFWEGSRTQQLRQALELGGHELAELQDKWKEMSPVLHLDAFRDKDVTVVVSNNDLIVPSSQQHSVVEQMNRVGVDPTVIETSLGHYATNGRFCISGFGIV